MRSSPTIRCEFQIRLAILTAVVFVGAAMPDAVASPDPEGTNAHSPPTAAARTRADGTDRRPSQDPPPLALCAEHYQAKRFAPARTCFQTLLARGERSATVRFALGYCHYQLKEFDAAERRFSEAVALSPKDGDLRFMWGMALAQLGREKRAREELRRALALGLQSEDPAEARRTLGLIERILASRPTPGWLLRFGGTLGYDSRPRMEGAAALAGTSDGESDSGSAVIELDAGFGYRWLHGRWGATSLAYGLKQRLVLSDVTSQGTGRAGRFGTPPPELSLQVHRLRLELVAVGQRVSGGIRVGGDVELAGLRSFGPLVAALPGEAELRLHLHRLATTRVALGAIGQRALDPAVDYLGGGGLWVGLGEELHWKWLRAQLSYEFSSWWLGTAVQPVSDCVAGEACALETPFTHVAHRLQLGLEARPLPWLRLRGEAGLVHRSYRPGALYRTAGGQVMTVLRRDLTQTYRFSLGFRTTKRLWLELAYRYVGNQSTVNEQAVGIDEGYSRHVAELSLLYETW